MKKVAIIGAGISGLYIADRLQQNGYKVTIFENNKMGGAILDHQIGKIKYPVSALFTFWNGDIVNNLALKANCKIKRTFNVISNVSITFTDKIKILYALIIYVVLLLVRIIAKFANLLYKERHLKISHYILLKCMTTHISSTNITTRQEKYTFWNDYCSKISKKMWLPIISGQDSPNLFKKKFTQHTQYINTMTIKEKVMNKKNLQKISSPFLQNITEGVETIYCRKIRIYPDNKQLPIFKKCFDTSRYIYNKGVDYLNTFYKNKLEEFKKLSENGCVNMDKKDKQCCETVIENSFLCKKHKKLKWNLPLTLPKLRPLVMKNDSDLLEGEKWLADVPYDTRQLIIKSLIGNVKACITNKKNGNINNFQLNFKCKKNPNQIFFFNKKAINKMNIFRSRLKKHAKLRVRKRYNRYYKYVQDKDGIILKEYNKYYILIPKNRKTIYNKPKHDIVALDPGVRTFQTFYSPSGVCGKIGDKFIKELEVKNKKIDLLTSLREKIKKAKTRHNLKRRLNLLRTKIKNKVADLHWKTCSYLVETYATIMIPEFESKKMANKIKRKINKKTTNNMLMLSHYKFLNKLKQKCEEYQRNLIIVNESYTSKTCSNCGYVDDKLGGKKIFKCKQCKLSIDRDVNGSRNILLHGLDTAR